jgi:hypothetical protein
MLMNHEDRADTHLASAVIQLSHEGMETDWPLEIMHPDGSVAEVCVFATGRIGPL